MVKQRSILAPLASDEDDDGEDKDSYTSAEQQYLIELTQPVTNLLSTMDSRPRSSRSKKGSSIVVPASSVSIIDRPSSARIVRIRLIFIHIGEIDTLNEKYQADIYYEARWTERRMNITALNLTALQQSQLINENLSIKITELNPSSCWLPQLFIENAIGQIGTQEKWFSIKRSKSRFIDHTPSLHLDVDICEHRRLKGVFWEKLELNHFPADVQDLTISITSHHDIEDCLLVQDEQNRSSINREAFVDQQKWFLYEHVATEMRQTQEEYSFDKEKSSGETKKHSVLSVTCRAARRPGYYYWNAFYLIFLITVAAFCIFSITPNLPQNRLQITCTLLLTSVTFRWVVNRSLPTVYYLTTLDIYAIVSIMFLVVLCIWHSVIASLIFHTSTKDITPNNKFVLIDRYVMIGTFIFYILIHTLMFLWLYFVPYQRRREMEYLDRQYAAKKHIRLDTSRSRFGSTQDLHLGRSPFMTSELPSINVDRMQRPKDNVTIVPDASSFFPVHDNSNQASRKAMDLVEVNHPQDDFYDQNSDSQDSTSMSQTEEIV